jgi:hypothetical protein
MNKLLFANELRNRQDDELQPRIEERGFITSSSGSSLRLIRDEGSAPQPIDRQNSRDHRLHVRRGRSPLDD